MGVGIGAQRGWLTHLTSEKTGQGHEQPPLSRPDRDAQDAAPPRSGSRGAPLARAMGPGGARPASQPASVPRSPPAWSGSSYCTGVRRLRGRRSSADSAVSASRLSPLQRSRNPSAAPPPAQSRGPARRARPLSARGEQSIPRAGAGRHVAHSGGTTFCGGRTRY